MVFSSDYILHMLSSYMLPFLRISSVLVAAPVFGTKIVPAPAKIVLAIFVTLLVFPYVVVDPEIQLFSITGMAVAVQQIIVGLAMGFMIRLIFSVLETGGYLIGQTMGLGFAQMVDPGNGISVPALSQFYTVMATLIFMAINGHIVVIYVIAESFNVLPVALQEYANFSIWVMIGWAGWIFKGAILISIPVLASLLIVQVAFGVMMRAAPQLNIFAIGFPISLILGFIFIYISLPLFADQFSNLMSASVQALFTMLGRQDG